MYSRELHPTPRVVGVLSDAVADARCIAAYGAAFRSIGVVADLESQLQSRIVDLVIVTPWDARGEPVAPVMDAIVRDGALPTVVAYVDRKAESIDELVRLLRAGVSSIVLRDRDDSPAALRRLLGAGLVAAVIADAQRVVTATVPEPACALIQYCLTHVGRPLSAPLIAQHFRVTPRTLTNWTARVDVRGIRGLLSRCRVVVALGLLAARRDSIEQIALELNFGSAAHLGNTVKRHTGVSLRTAMDRGDHRFWAQTLLCHRVLHPNSPLEVHALPLAHDELPPEELVHTRKEPHIRSGEFGTPDLPLEH